jgi:hypothetical protein
MVIIDLSTKNLKIKRPTLPFKTPQQNKYLDLNVNIEKSPTYISMVVKKQKFIGNKFYIDSIGNYNSEYFNKQTGNIILASFGGPAIEIYTSMNVRYFYIYVNGSDKERDKEKVNSKFLDLTEAIDIRNKILYTVKNYNYYMEKNLKLLFHYGAKND